MRLCEGKLELLNYEEEELAESSESISGYKGYSFQWARSRNQNWGVLDFRPHLKKTDIWKLARFQFPRRQINLITTQ